MMGEPPVPKNKLNGIIGASDFYHMLGVLYSITVLAANDFGGIRHN